MKRPADYPLFMGHSCKWMDAYISRTSSPSFSFFLLSPCFAILSLTDCRRVSLLTFNTRFTAPNFLVFFAFPIFLEKIDGNLVENNFNFIPSSTSGSVDYVTSLLLSNSFSYSGGAILPALGTFNPAPFPKIDLGGDCLPCAPIITPFGIQPYNLKNVNKSKVQRTTKIKRNPKV
jgi:hypothetical protein